MCAIDVPTLQNVVAGQIINSSSSAHISRYTFLLFVKLRSPDPRSAFYLMVVMDKIAVFFVLVVVAFSNVQSLPQDHDHHVVHGDDLEYLHDREFHLWLYEYYEGDKEHWAEIYPTWKKNAEFVKEHNSLGHLSYRLSLNKFAHLVSQ